MARSKKETLACEIGGNVLDSIGANAPAESSTASAAPRAVKDLRLDGLIRAKDVASIPLAKIEPDPQQPRKEFEPEGISRLAASLKSRGQLQPIRVRWNPERSIYQIVVGERRWRAAGEAGLPALACVIHDGPIEDKDLRAIQLVENCVREDLNEIDQAKAMRDLIQSHGWSQYQLADELGIRQSTVSKALALLTLAPQVQAKVQDGTIPAASAYPISHLESPEEQIEVAKEVEANKLGRDETAAVVKGKKSVKASAKAPKGKGRGASKKAPKLETEKIYNDAPFKFVVTCRKGIEPAALHQAVVRWADWLQAAL